MGLVGVVENVIADRLGRPGARSPRRGYALAGQGESRIVYGPPLRPNHLEDAPHHGYLVLANHEAVFLRREGEAILRAAAGDYFAFAGLLELAADGAFTDHLTLPLREVVLETIREAVARVVERDELDPEICEVLVP